MPSIAELTLQAQLDIARIPYEREYRFLDDRKFRADFKVTGGIEHFKDPPQTIHYDDLLIEIEGGGWINGRHSRGGGMEADCEKSALAAIAGYRVMRVTPAQVNDGRALRWIIEATEARKAA